MGELAVFRRGSAGTALPDYRLISDASATTSFFVVKEIAGASLTNENYTELATLPRKASYTGKPMGFLSVEGIAFCVITKTNTAYSFPVGSHNCEVRLMETESKLELQMRRLGQVGSLGLNFSAFISYTMN